MASQVNSPGPVRAFDKWSPHGVGQERGEVIDRGLFLYLGFGQNEAIGLGEDHAQVVRGGLSDRLGQGTEVGLPGFIFLAQALEAGLHES
jgi:hypothetical protein